MSSPLLRIVARTSRFSQTINIRPMSTVVNMRNVVAEEGKPKTPVVPNLNPNNYPKRKSLT